MFGMGMPEILVILAVALIVIGPKKLPDLAKSLGRAIGEFRKATTDLKESLIVDTEIKAVKSSFKGQNSVADTQPDAAGQPAGEKGLTEATSDAKPVKSASSPQASQESDNNA
ncbi:MAG: twin-arginine translocase TatA/TatE family subunit [Pseudomonadota bacterium]